MKVTDRQLIKAFKEGLTHEAIAKRHGVNRKTVSLRLEKLGLTRRGTAHEIKQAKLVKRAQEVVTIRGEEKKQRNTINIFEGIVNSLDMLRELANTNMEYVRNSNEIIDRIAKGFDESGKLIYSDKEELKKIREDLDKFRKVINDQELSRQDKVINSIRAMTPIYQLVAGLKEYFDRHDTAKVYLQIMLHEIGKESEQVRYRIGMRIKAVQEAVSTVSIISGVPEYNEIIHKQADMIYEQMIKNNQGDGKSDTETAVQP